jgi:hypothetical protein
MSHSLSAMKNGVPPEGWRDETEFIVTLPAGWRSGAAAVERLARHLGATFPTYVFVVEPNAAVAEANDYVVIPITGYLDEDGVGQVKDRPPQSVIDEVGAAIAEFEPAARSGLN